MKKKAIFILLKVFIILMGMALAQEKTKDFPVLKGPYLGQKPPGMTPEIFAPGIISTDDWEFGITFSKNGKDLFFTRRRTVKEVIDCFI